MSWLIRDVLTQAREIIQDTRSPTRHSDEKLLQHYNASLSEARRLRPDMFIDDYSEAGVWDALPLITDTEDLDYPFPLEEQYFQTVVFYVAGMVGISDDEYANDGRAVGILNKFKLDLTGARGTL